MSAWADAVTQADIQVLYRRFQTLDRRKKGYISMDEFLNIPELSINPLSQRLVTLFENVNFEDFVKLIAVFTDKASKEEKLRVMFSIWDVDGDKRVSRDDLAIVLRQRAGSSLTGGELQSLIDKVLEGAGVGPGGALSFEEFCAVFQGSSLEAMQTESPQVMVEGFVI